MSAISFERPASLHIGRLASPLGEVLLVSDQAGILRALDFHDYEARLLRLLRVHYDTLELRSAAPPAAVTSHLLDYFDGDLEAPRRIRWATAGTDFQRSVWNALVGIPTGRTSGYGELARSLGKPQASRAVGLANGANPIAIVVPCHRVIGANGNLTGYAGGLDRKRWLLKHEGALPGAGTERDLFATAGQIVARF